MLCDGKCVSDWDKDERGERTRRCGGCTSDQKGQGRDDAGENGQ